MNMLKHKISKDEAITAVVEHVKKTKRGAIPAISEVEERTGEWIVRGTCPRDVEGSTWAEKFEILVDAKGKVKSADYALRWQKKENDESWTIYTNPPAIEAIKEKETPKEEVPEESVADFSVTDEKPDFSVTAEKPVIEVSKPEPLKEAISKKENLENQMNMEIFEQADRRIELLKAKKKQLTLESERLKKKLEEKVSSLELEVKGMESEIRRMKLLVADDTDTTYEDPSIEAQTTN